MSLEIIIGKNKTGKTKYLENKYKNKEEHNVLYIPSEIHYFEDVIKDKNYSTPKSKDYTPQSKMLNFIKEKTKIIDTKFQLNEQQKQKLSEWKNLFHSFNKEKINGDDDEYFDSFLFDEYIKVKDINDNKIEINYDFFQEKNIKGIEEGDTSSGSGNYSLIKFLYKLLSIDTNLFTFDKDWVLVIDEVEKFSHPELIFKMAKLIISISMKIDVVVTTHSPLFLERIFYLHKKWIKEDCEIQIKYFLKYRENKEGEDIEEQIIKQIKELDSNKIKKIIKEWNYRDLSNLSKTLFASNVILLEGILDNTLINEIITNNDDEKLQNQYYTILDCAGKGNIKKIYNAISDLNLLELIKLFLFYDLDNEKTIKVQNNVFKFENNPDLEQSFFDVEFDSNGKVLSVKLKDFEGKNYNTMKIKDFKKEENFLFTPEWIIQHTTKDMKTVVDQLNALHKEIKNFLQLKK